MSAERFRLVVLGSGKVGKTSIIKKYLYDEFSEKYRETVEDMHSREFRIRGSLLPLDIMDTNFYYPEMRKLSIASANAFLMVFSVENVVSFKDVTEVMEEVIKLRSDVDRLPIIVVGNKTDLPGKKIFPETTKAWLGRLPIKSDIRYLEVSAKNGDNIVETFRALLDVSGFPNNMQQALNPSNLLAPTGPAQKRARSFRGRSPSRRTSAESESPKKEHPGGPGRSRLSRAFSKKETKGDVGGLTRHESLVRRTQRLSLKIKNVPEDDPDESNCIIS